MYQADRLLHPLKRVGRKGEGRFERISWDEALDTIAARFLEISASADGPGAILPYDYAGTMGYVKWKSMGKRFFHRLDGHVPPHKERQHHVRIDDDVANGKERNHLGDLHLGSLAFLRINIPLGLAHRPPVFLKLTLIRLGRAVNQALRARRRAGNPGSTASRKRTDPTSSEALAKDLFHVVKKSF